VDAPDFQPTTRKPIKLKFDPDYPAPNIPASWNVYPTDPMLAAVRSQDGKRIGAVGSSRANRISCSR